MKGKNKKGGGGTLTRKIIFQPTVLPVKGNGLKEMDRLLGSLENRMIRIQNAAGRLATSGLGFSQQAIQQKLQKFSLGNQLTSANITKQLKDGLKGVKQSDIDHILAEYQGRLKKGMVKNSAGGALKFTDVFQNVKVAGGKQIEVFKTAARASQFYAKEVLGPRHAAAQQMMQAMFGGGKIRPGVSPAQLAHEAALAPGRKVSTVLQGSDFVVTVTGKIPVVLGPEHFAGVGTASGTHGGTTGRFQPGGPVAAGRVTRRGSRGRGAGTGTVDPKEAREEARRQKGIGMHIEGLRQRAATDEAADLKELHQAQKRALAAAKAGYKTEEHWRKRVETITERVQKRRADLLVAEALANEREMKSREKVRTEQAVVKDKLRGKAQVLSALEELRASGATETQGPLGTRVLRNGRVVDTRSSFFDQTLEDGRTQRTTVKAEYDRAPGAPPPLPGALPTGALRGATLGVQVLDKSAKGLLATMAANTVKLATWHVGMLAFYGALAAAAKALQVMTDTGLQTARLGQVFRGVGGSAADLSMDVIQLAGAEGRSREEALASAIAWSRLGLTRKQVNEAVRVSLQAANVAEIDAATAGEHLQAVMRTFGLTVGDLSTVLGTFNSLSNETAVTNKALFEAFSVGGAIAKQAGFSWEEYAGIVAATVERTKQTGRAVATAFKSTLSTLADPRIQQMFRDKFAIELTMPDTGELKEGSQALGEIWEAYQTMTGGQQKALTYEWGGKQQVARITAILSSYVDAQVKAANAQLKLNSADEESAKIRKTLSSRVQGLGAEVSGLLVALDRTSDGTSGLGEVAEAFRNITHWATLAVDKAREMGRIKIPMPGGESLGISPLQPMPSPWKMMNIGFRGVEREYKKYLPSESDKRETMFANARTLSGEAGAFGGSAQLLERLGRVGDSPDLRRSLGHLNTLSPEFKRSLSGPVTPDQLAAEASRMREAAASKAQAADLEFSRGVARLRGDITLATVREHEGKGGGKRKELEAELEERTKKHAKVVASLEEDVNLLEAVANRTQKVGDLLERQKETLGAIAQIYSDLPGNTLESKLHNETNALREQLMFLEERKRALEGSNLNRSERSRVSEEIRTAISGTKSALDAKTSPDVLDAVRRADRGRIARRLTSVENESAGRGGSEFEKILTREKRLIADIAQLQREISSGRRSGIDQENALNAVIQKRNDLAETLIQKNEEIIRAQAKQEEMNRKLLTAGPQELLRQLGARRFVQSVGGDLSGARAQRSFFSQSAAQREAILEQLPIFNAQRTAGGTRGGTLTALQRNVQALDEANGVSAAGLRHSRAPGAAGAEAIPLAAAEAGKLSTAFGALRQDMALTGGAFVALRTDLGALGALLRRFPMMGRGGPPEVPGMVGR